MNDSRFIELLNLYVDHQITQDEAAELEAAIAGNHARRRTYQDYCRMQRACGLLVARECTQAPASFAFQKSLQEAERKIIAFPGRQKAARRVYTAAFAGMAAMAACIAFVVLHGGFQPGERGRQETAPAVMVASVAQPTTGNKMEALVAQQSFVAQNVAVSRQPETLPAEQRLPLEWMQRVELPPVQRVLVDDNTFEVRPTLQQDNRVFRGRHPVQGNAEFAAFQFQR